MPRERIVTISGVPPVVGSIGLAGLSGYEGRTIGQAAIPKGATPFPGAPGGYVIGPRVIPGKEIYLIGASEVVGMKAEMGVSIIKLLYYKMDRTPWSIAEHDDIERQVKAGNRWTTILTLPTAGAYYAIYVAPATSEVARNNRGALAELIRSSRAAGREVLHAGSEIVKTTIEAGRDVLKETMGLGQLIMRAIPIVAVVGVVGAAVYGLTLVTGGRGRPDRVAAPTR